MVLMQGVDYKQESPTRFVFYSKTQKGQAHIVDLIEGECSCQQYQFRILPLIRRDLIHPDDDTSRCKHIRWARELLTNQIIEQLREVEKQKK